MNVLFLTHRLPYAPNRGDRIRAFHLMREISRFAEISLFSLVHDEDEARRAEAMPFATRTRVARVVRARNLARGALQLAGRTPLTHALLDAPGSLAAIDSLVAARRPDLVLAYCSGMARFALMPPLAAFPWVLDMVDVDSVKWREAAARARPPLSWIYAREARTLGAFEADAARSARATLVVNARERDAILALAPDAPVHVVPNGIDANAWTPPGPPVADPVVVFTGVMNYGPNDEGTRWFIRDVWPLVRRDVPAARFIVVGAHPTRALRSLAAADRSVEVTGMVDDVRPYLWRAAVSVAPLALARGLQNKVLEALAAGLPCVVTSNVIEGLPAVARAGCVRKDDGQGFAEAVVSLLGRAPGARREMAEAANVSTLDWTRALADVRSLLTAAAASRC